MAIKIGGFAAFFITAVVVAGAERIVHTVVNRPKAKRKSAAQERFWLALDKAYVNQKALAKDQSAEEFEEDVKVAVRAEYDAAVLDTRDEAELETFRQLLQSKWEALYARK